MGKIIFAVQMCICLLALVIGSATSDDVNSSTSTSVSVSTVTRKVTSRSRHVDVSPKGTAAAAEDLPVPEVPEADKSSPHSSENGEGVAKFLKIKKKILASNLKNISERHNLLKSVANSTEDSDTSGKLNASDSAEDDLPEDVFIKSANGTADFSENKTWSEGSKSKNGGAAVEGRSLEDRSSEENVNVNGNKKTKGPLTPTYEAYGGGFQKLLNNNFLNTSEGFGLRAARPFPSGISSSKKSTPILRDNSLKNAIRFDGEYYGPAGQTDWVPIGPDKLSAKPSQQLGGRPDQEEKLNKTSERNAIVFPTESNVILVREAEMEKTTPRQRRVENQRRIPSSTESWRPTSDLHQPLVHSTKSRDAFKYRTSQSNFTVEEKKLLNETTSRRSNGSGAGMEIPVTVASWTQTTLGRSTEKAEEVTEISVVKVLSTTNHTGKFQNGGVVVPPENVKIENVTKKQREGLKTANPATNVEEDKGKHNKSDIMNSLPKIMEGWSSERGKVGGSANETDVVVPGSVDANQSNDSTEVTKASTHELETTPADVTITTENIPELTTTETIQKLSSQSSGGEQPATVALDGSSTTEESIAKGLAHESVTPTSEVDAPLTTLGSEAPLEAVTTGVADSRKKESPDNTSATAHAKADADTTTVAPLPVSAGVITTTTSPSTSDQEAKNKMTSAKAVNVINTTPTSVLVVDIFNATATAITKQSTEFINVVDGATTPEGEGIRTTAPNTATAKITTPANKTTKTITSTPKPMAPTTTTPKPTEPSTTTPKSTGPTTKTPKSTEPSTTTPKSTEPSTTTPKSTEPTTTTPKSTEPTTTTPKSTEPSTTTPKSTEPTTTTPKSTESTTTTASATTRNQESKSEAVEEGIYYKNYIPTTISPHDEITEENVPAYLRLTVQAASWQELCRLKEDLRESIIKMLGGKNVSAESVHFLNLNDRNCEEKMEETRGDSVANRTLFLPVNMFLMDRNGDFDKNLSEAFLTLWGRRGLDFELPIRKVDFVTPIVNLTELADSPLGGSVVAAIVISCVAGICVILLGILFVIMKRRQKRFNYGQRCTPVSLDAYSLDSVSIYNSVRRKGMRASKRSYGNAAFDDPEVPTHPMNFAGIANFSSDKEQLFEEFNVIPQVYPKAEELPAGAETKNRYANIIPLPETRVHLSAKDDDPLSDYINANYVRGLKGAEKLYIACQAPMESTIEDFWRMVWEQQCKVILMLTDLQENGVEKCADYLPPNEVTDNLRLFGDFQVTLKKRDVKEKYIISNLNLKNMEANLWREVTHLWYLGWPDQGVPPEANSLIAFLIEARSQTKVQNGATTSGPAVVHCSPGTGRTGTVIACDLSIREYEQSRMVDVPKCVFSLRRDRAGAVQTKDQYAFIYQVLKLLGVERIRDQVKRRRN